MRVVTCSAPVNIALIKYWGKRNEDLILPLNDSISFTLGQDEMCAKTTIAASPSYDKDRFWLNGKEESLSNPRVNRCLQEIRRRVAKRKLDGADIDLLNWHIHICSKNNFPTAAGLASSAAGYACLVYTLGQLYNIGGDISTIARQGSGSACRSMYGGLVRWHMGRQADGSDSIAKQLDTHDQWKDISVIICVVSDNRKKTSSTSGMQKSVETSKLLHYRVTETVNTHINTLIEAVQCKNWSDICDVTMSDSNQMHAICCDTFPPCIYMNDTSNSIVNLIYAYNQIKTDKKMEKGKVCYTYDAGPNACIFIPDESMQEFATILLKAFPPAVSIDEYIKGKAITQITLSEQFEDLVKLHQETEGKLKYIIHTKVGPGPKLLSDEWVQEHHLIDLETGLPSQPNS